MVKFVLTILELPKNPRVRLRLFSAIVNLHMINFVKRNWALVILIVIGLNWLRVGVVNKSRTNSITGSTAEYYAADSMGQAAPSALNKVVSPNFPGRQVAPADTSSRMVIHDSSLSLKVKDVSTVISSIESVAKNFGGYLVDSNQNSPDESAKSGHISLRVPESKRAEAMTEFKKLAVKVVSESVYGNDVTDEYVDLDSRLAILIQSKSKYEDLMARAVNVNDILNVTDRLSALQQQIDSLKGQQKFYEQSAKLSKITIYLSTDELALPYAPTNEWRPAVIFKEAVRSLVTSIRSLGTLLIWLVVYLPVLIPLGIIFLFFRRRVKN